MVVILTLNININKESKTKMCERVDETKIKFWYGYFNNGLNREPIVTVASYLMEDGTVSRGISVCSDYEIPDKKRGRKIQIERLKMAVKAQKNCLPINWENETKFPRDSYMSQKDVPAFSHKSIYKDEYLTELEEKLFHTND